jgi:hypothetical protein
MKTLCVALLLVAGQAPPPLRPPEIAATAQFCLGSDLSGPWQAFAVEMDSRSTRDLDVLIRIEDDNYLTAALRRERLSPGARKRVFLYAPGGPWPRNVPARYRITEGSGRELASGFIAVSPRGYVANVWQVGLFSRTPAAEEDFGVPASVSGLEVRFARLSVATFPDQWIGLAALDLLLLHDAPLDELTADQGRALADYVRQGGTVMLSPGPAKGWLTHPALRAIAPVRVAESQEVFSLTGLNGIYGPFVRADPFLVQPLLNGAEFKAGLEQEIVRFDAGFGRTFVLGFDLRRAPFDTWRGRHGLWSDLFAAAPRWSQEDRASFPSAATPRARTELFQQIARMINPYPSYWLIFGLAALFLITIGPLNYLFLWRIRRTLLLVVTVPGISIGFLGLILGLGYLIKGTTTVVHSARLLTTRSGADCAREIQLYSLFSPSTRSYDVSCARGTFGQPHGRIGSGEDRTYGRPQEAMTNLTCETGAGITFRGLGTGQWQNWDLEGRALRDLGRGVRFDPIGPTIRIANDSPRMIERGVYIQTGREAVVVPFGPLAPGTAAEARIDGPRIPPLEALGLSPESLGDRLLRAWLEGLLRPRRPEERLEQARFLICVLREDDATVTVDARISDRSRSITLLHVGEAP